MLIAAPRLRSRSDGWLRGSHKAWASCFKRRPRSLNLREWVYHICASFGLPLMPDVGPLASLGVSADWAGVLVTPLLSLDMVRIMPVDLTSLRGVRYCGFWVDLVGTEGDCVDGGTGVRGFLSRSRLEGALGLFDAGASVGVSSAARGRLSATCRFLLSFPSVVLRSADFRDPSLLDNSLFLATPSCFRILSGS